MMLNKSEILTRIATNPPMVTDLIDLNTQIQPAGLDLTIKNIFSWKSSGTLDFDNSQRILSEKHPIPPVRTKVAKVYYLPKGSYQIEHNEQFNIPTDVVAFTISRSSLQRCGCAVLQGCYDPGYSGPGFTLLEVNNPHGLYLYNNARICQMNFYTTKHTEAYNGIYQKSPL